MQWITRARLGRETPLEICDELLRWEAGFPRIMSRNGQNDLEVQGQWPPFSIPTERTPWCMFGAHLVIPAQICDELLCGQAEFPRTLSQNGQNDLEVQGQWLPFSILAESILGCMFGANLVILAQICDTLLCAQAGFPRILSRNGLNIFEVKGQYPPFSIPYICCDLDFVTAKLGSNDYHCNYFYSTILRRLSWRFMFMKPILAQLVEWQTITLINVDPNVRCQMASLVHDELMTGMVETIPALITK